jgi:hypothetical protein
MTFKIVGTMTLEVVEMKLAQALERLYELSQAHDTTEAHVLAITSLYDRLKSEQLNMRAFPPVVASASPQASVNAQAKHGYVEKSNGYLTTECAICGLKKSHSIHMSEWTNFPSQ